MKVVIIGYGSIGRKHAKILSQNFKKIKIYIYTKQTIKNFNCFKDINEIKTINPQYIIIASETHRHYKQLKFLEKNFKKIKILIEKPLFFINSIIFQLKIMRYILLITSDFIPW